MIGVLFGMSVAAICTGFIGREVAPHASIALALPVVVLALFVGGVLGAVLAYVERS